MRRCYTDIRVVTLARSIPLFIINLCLYNILALLALLPERASELSLAQLKPEKALKLSLPCSFAQELTSISLLSISCWRTILNYIVHACPEYER